MFKLKRHFQITTDSQAFKKIFKRLGLIFLMAFGSFFLLFAITTIIVLSIIHQFDPTQYGQIMVNLKVVNSTTQLGSFVDDAVKAMEAVLYVIFIKPILWILNQTSQVVNFLGSGIVSQKVLFGTKNTFWNVPLEFWVVLIVAIAIIVILLTIKLIIVMCSHYEKQGAMFRSTITNTLGAIVLMLLIPVIFISINFIVVTITEFIISNSGPKQVNLGLWIFNASFDNGFQNFTSVPDTFNFADSEHFNYIICLFAEGFMVYILFLISINLFTRVFELLLLYCVSPLVVGSIVSDTTGNYKTMRNWSNVVLQRFILFFFIFAAYNIFLNSISLFAEISKLIPVKTTRPIFVLIGILGAGVVVIKAPNILNSIIGGEASILDSLSHITGIGTASRGFIVGGGLMTSGISKLITTTETTVSLAKGAVGTIGAGAAAATIMHHAKTPSTSSGLSSGLGDNVGQSNRMTANRIDNLIKKSQTEM